MHVSYGQNFISLKIYSKTGNRDQDNHYVTDDTGDTKLMEEPLYIVPALLGTGESPPHLADAAGMGSRSDTEGSFKLCLGF